MTKDRNMTHDTPGENADERLRAELLTSALSDWVSLAEVQQIISHFSSPTPIVSARTWFSGPSAHWSTTA
jgi:hypothetical protein